MESDSVINLREELPPAVCRHYQDAALVAARRRTGHEGVGLQPAHETRGERGCDIKPLGQIAHAPGHLRPHDLNQCLVLEGIEPNLARLLVDDSRDLANHVPSFGDTSPIGIEAGVIPSTRNPAVGRQPLVERAHKLARVPFRWISLFDHANLPPTSTSATVKRPKLIRCAQSLDYEHRWIVFKVKYSRTTSSCRRGGLLKIVVPDLISNSYFPAIAAVELGCARDEGLDATVELLFPVDAAYRALAAGEVDVVAGSAHSVLAAFPNWDGARLIAAQGQGMYWFLVMRKDIGAARNDVSVVRGKRIGAAPWVDLGLIQLLADSGIEPEAVDIIPVPGASGAGTNFGLAAAQALASGTIDGFWANGMGAETAVRSGAGDVVLDIRRGDGPPESFHYTFASLAATHRFIESDRGRAEALVRALRRAQALLAADPEVATVVGERLFPAEQAELIGELVRRDAPFYHAEISSEAIAGMNRFARARGLVRFEAPYEQIVADVAGHGE